MRDSERDSESQGNESKHAERSGGAGFLMGRISRAYLPRMHAMLQ